MECVLLVSKFYVTQKKKKNSCNLSKSFLLLLFLFLIQLSMFSQIILTMLRFPSMNTSPYFSGLCLCFDQRTKNKNTKLNWSQEVKEINFRILSTSQDDQKNTNVGISHQFIASIGG